MHDQHHFELGSLSEKELWVGAFRNISHDVHDKWLAPAEQHGCQLCWFIQIGKRWFCHVFSHYRQTLATLAWPWTGHRLLINEERVTSLQWHRVDTVSRLNRNYGKRKIVFWPAKRKISDEQVLKKKCRGLDVWCYILWSFSPWSHTWAANLHPLCHLV